MSLDKFVLTWNIIMLSRKIWSFIHSREFKNFSSHTLRPTKIFNKSKFHHFFSVQQTPIKFLRKKFLTLQTRQQRMKKMRKEFSVFLEPRRDFPSRHILCLSIMLSNLDVDEICAALKTSESSEERKWAVLSPKHSSSLDELCGS